MSTRGCFGMRYAGRDYIVYNPSDSYPEALGKRIKMEVAAIGAEALRNAAKKIKLVEPESLPSEQQLSEIKKAGFYSPQEGANWRQTILYGGCGELSLSAWATGGLVYMPDDHEFLWDDVMCEWAYVANLDTEKLEIYAGFTKQEQLRGRYVEPDGHQLSDNKRPTFGVHLVAEVAFAELGTMPDQAYFDIAHGKAVLGKSDNVPTSGNGKQIVYIVANASRTGGGMHLEATRDKEEARSMFAGMVTAGFAMQGIHKDETGLTLEECVDKGKFSSRMMVAALEEKEI